MLEFGILVQILNGAALRNVLVKQGKLIEKIFGETRNLLEKGGFKVGRIIGSQIGFGLEKRCDLGLCGNHSRDDVPLNHIAQSESFDLNDLDIVFDGDFFSGMNFCFRENAATLEKLDVLFFRQVGKYFRCRFKIQESALFSFLNPLFGVVVAVENNPVVFAQCLFCKCRGIRKEIDARFELIGKTHQAVCDNRIQNNVRHRDGLARTRHAEFEFIARKGKRRSPVSVCRILCEVGKDLCADGHFRLSVAVGGRVRNDRAYYFIEFFADKDRDDGRRRLVGTETVIVGGACDGEAHEILMQIESFDDGRKEEKELCVLTRRIAGLEKIDTVVRCEGPVVVLAAAVYTGKGLFVKKAAHTVSHRYACHHLHHQLVLIGRDIRDGEDRCQFMLARCDFVMFGLCIDSKLPELAVQFFHEGGNTRLDDTEIMILEFLPFRGFRTDQGASAVDQIRTCEIVLLVDEEILLLRADCCLYAA